MSMAIHITENIALELSSNPEQQTVQCPSKVFEATDSGINPIRNTYRTVLMDAYTRMSAHPRVDFLLRYPHSPIVITMMMTIINPIL
mmetsp:Transcript_22520/g.22222  ORF Transcript_22520/g.22222 Transcript_22520/m.22222 type:complete len:87 (+) Transcript_22520:86-346(+)